MPLSKSVGARIKRREDPSLIRGLGQYVDDVKLPEMLHVAILRSPHAHARIKSIDTAAAALWNRMTVEEMTALDLAYAPPFAPVWDPILVAARQAAGAVRQADAARR